MEKPSLNQISTLITLLKNVEMVKTQFGDDNELGARLYEALKNISMWDYRGILLARKFNNNRRIREILLNQGLKPIIPDYMK